MRARLVECAPRGWEECEEETEIVFAVYGDPAVAADLERVFGEVVSGTVVPDWQDRWREFHRPITIGPWWIGPPWLSPPDSSLAVVIDPGRAFGTGAHATTRLCLELVHTVVPCSLADLGCGSGVVAIAAAMIGFAPIVAIDRDEAAVEETERNAQANGVVLEVRWGDVCVDALPDSDLAVANLERDLIPAVTKRLRSRRLIASGYLARDVAVPDGWRRLDRREADGWVADLFERQ